MTQPMMSGIVRTAAWPGKQGTDMSEMERVADLALLADPSIDRAVLGEGTFEDLSLGQMADLMAGSDKQIRKIAHDQLAHPLADVRAIRRRQALVKAMRTDEGRVCASLKTITARTRAGMAAVWGSLDDGYGTTTDRLGTAVARLHIGLKGLQELSKLLHGCRIADPAPRAVASPDDTNGCEGRQNGGDDTRGDSATALLRQLAETIDHSVPDGDFAAADRLLDRFSHQKNLIVLTGFDPLLHQRDVRALVTPDGPMALADRIRWMAAPRLRFGESDVAAAQDLTARREAALAPAAEVLIRACLTVTRFFDRLDDSLAFLAGSVSLHKALHSHGGPVCFPSVTRAEGRAFSCADLREVPLAVRGAAVGTDLGAPDLRLCLITGANQGGKTTFLTAVGQARVMAQCGLPIAARSLTAPVRRSILTHFRREEDSSLHSGKLEEELHRAARLVEQMRSPALVLFDESFASTNERDGSLLNEEIDDGLLHAGCEIWSVTHLTDYARHFYGVPCVVSLVAPRGRTFRLVQAAPASSADGLGLARRILGADDVAHHDAAHHKKGEKSC